VTGPVISLAALLGAAAGYVAVFVLRPGWSDATSAAFLVAAMALPCAAAEFLLHQRKPQSGFDFSKPRPSLHRILRKLTALWVILAALLFCYAALPLYRTELYQPFHWLLRNVLLVFLLLSIPYVALVDAFQSEPEDRLHALGDRLLGSPAPFTGEDLNYLLGWAVKGFFLPLMFSYLCGQITGIRELHDMMPAAATLKDVASRAYDIAYAHIFFMDVLVATAGYVMTLRILGTEIRSVEPTVAGWLVAIACYDPFWPALFSNFFRYTHDVTWGSWLAGQPVLYTLWAAAILAVLSVYGWAAVSFGIRFSNLTNRGIITSGPYRFTKHPAYIAKNISWWLISIPFMPADGSPFTALQLCLGLAGINLIYFARARTEERHLSRDPVYREYAEYIREHGVFRWLKPRNTKRAPLRERVM
jgi:protein-S-isoprenylcysteine O-methyltransferase Ste14